MRLSAALLMLCLSGSLALAASPKTPPPRGNSTAPAFQPTWQAMPMGDGGQKTGFDYHPSTGVMLVRNDTYGGHLYKSTGTCSNGKTLTYMAPCWQQLVTSTSMPARDVTLDNGATGNVGTVELVSCAGNRNVFYMLWNTYLYVSTDQGAHWVKAGAGGGLRTGQNANGGPKDRGKFLWCDPADANGNIVFVATVGGVTGAVDGLFRSSNGTAGSSATFSQVTSAGTPTSGFPQLIAHDPNSKVVDGVTQHVYVWTQGSGVYETTNGGVFSLTTGSPTSLTAVKLRIDKFSQVWLIDGSKSIWVRESNAWKTRVYSGINGIANIAFDPSSTSVAKQRLIGSWYDGNMFVSNDNGQIWNANNPSGMLRNTFIAPAPQPPWLATANQCNSPCTFGTFFNALDYVIDSSLVAWAAGGIAPWKTSVLTGSPTTQWTADAVGIEQLVTNRILAPPGSPPTMVTWDRGVLLIQVPGKFPTLQVPNTNTISQIQAAWSADYSGTTPAFMAMYTVSNAGSGDYLASTSDGGYTWTRFPAYPTGKNGPGGAIAVSSPSNMIVYPFIQPFSSGLQYTSDGAKSWAISSINGCSNNFVTSYYNNRQPLAADKAKNGTFYVVDQAQNICASTDNGAHFARVRSGPIEGFSYRDVIKTVPGQAGHFFYTLGPQNKPSGKIRLWKTTNGGPNLGTVGATLRDPWYIGFGAPPPTGGSGYPTIYAVAFLGGAQCICQSVDGGLTWTPINVPSSEVPWPMGSVDFIQDISGDMNVYGRVMVSWIGSGASFIDTADACPWVNFTNVKPTQSLTGTVSLTAEHSGQVPVTGVNFYLDGVHQIGTTQTGAGPYSVSFDASAQTVGNHTLTVKASGNNPGCTMALSTGNSFTIPITTR